MDYYQVAGLAAIFGFTLSLWITNHIENYKAGMIFLTILIILILEAAK